MEERPFLGEGARGGGEVSDILPRDGKLLGFHSKTEQNASL